MPASRRDAAAHVFVPSIESPELDDVDRHHVARVLRLRSGEAVTASDGAGSWRSCVYAGDGRVEPAGPVEFEARMAPVVTVGFALTKGDKPEWAVQKLTEVGVDIIVPFVAARSVVRWDADRAARAGERFDRVAREAAMQSRRAWLPEVRPVAAFGSAVAAAPSPPALAEPGGDPVSLTNSCVFVGPEGGWSSEELEAGLPNVSLGSTILRAETATLAVGVLLCGLRSRAVEEFVQNHER